MGKVIAGEQKATQGAAYGRAGRGEAVVGKQGQMGGVVVREPVFGVLSGTLMPRMRTVPPASRTWSAWSRKVKIRGQGPAEAETAMV